MLPSPLPPPPVALDLAPSEPLPSPSRPSLAAVLVPRLTVRVTYFTGSSALALYPESAAERWQWPVSQGLTVELRLLWTLDGATRDRDERDGSER